MRVSYSIVAIFIQLPGTRHAHCRNTAEIDDRFGAGKVSSRIGLHRLQNYLTKIHHYLMRFVRK